MSKGNLFLGQARGKVGDVVFYRQNGEQITRTRNRNPRNPKSDAQLVQRAISATVVQAYRAGKAIFDHAFEGRQIPSGNQRRFLKVNMKKLRSQVLTELSMAANESVSRVVSPSAVYPVPNAYRISEGSLTQSIFSIITEEQTGYLSAAMADAEENESVAEYAARVGLIPGDIYTMVGFCCTSIYSENDLLSPQTAFGFSRLIVKDDVLTSTTAMSAARYEDLFIENGSTYKFPLIQLVSLPVWLMQIVETYPIADPTPQRLVGVGSMGVIRSREDSGLRSTSDMVTNIQANGESVNIWGVAPINLVDAWSPDASGLSSPLILEGGGF